ncbi:MAG: C4-dicarboxylate transport sensor protein DctB [candidate division BRC1 bacterium ADurb.BinA292]|nr:MAG: C4-dicarboxylate transport sensor protein DctB [candidate division BRC1 bacterium ADurb.BinA292]
MITRHPHSRTLVIRTYGNLDALQVEHYRQQIRLLVDNGYRSLIFDLEETPFINSSALGLLVELHNTMRRLNGSVRLVNCSEQIVWMLQQTRLDVLLLVDEPPRESVPEPTLESLHSLMVEEVLLLSHINQFTEQAFRETEPVEIGRMILRTVMQALKSARGIVFLLGEDGRVMRLIHHEGAPLACPAEQIREVHLGHAKLEDAILKSQDVSWHEFSGFPAPEEWLFRKIGFASMLAAPIASGERCFGLLAVEGSEETAHALRAVRPLLRTLTNICGLAIEKAHLLSEVRTRNAELEHAVARLKQFHQSLHGAGRLAAMGTVVSGLGHQLNNKMVPLVGYTQLLMMDKNLGEQQKQRMESIHKTTQEIKEIVEKLVKVARPSRADAGQCDLGLVIQTALDLLSEPIGKNRISIRVNLGQEPVALGGDPTALLQVLVAILHRACHSFAPDAEESRVWIIGSVAEGNLRLCIEDNGDDLDEFDTGEWADPLVPFQAMKHGRLFNYTIPRSLLSRMHGKLQLEPREGGGKRVVIDLPVGQDAPPAAGAAARPDAGAPRSSRPAN